MDHSSTRLWALAALLSLCSSCYRVDDPGAQASGAARADEILAECAKVSACSGVSANSCFATVADKDSWQLYGGRWNAREIELRADCMAAATDCAQVTACIDEAHQAFEEEQGLLIELSSCDPQLGEYTHCENGILVWCFVGDEDTDAWPIPIDVGDLGLTCNTAGSYAADPGHPQCAYGTGTSEGCDGTGAFECVSGERVTTDCRDIDPDFVCTTDTDEPERPLCALPAARRECERGDYTNSGDWGTCEGNVARVCAGRKLYEVDCAAFPGASCVQQNYSAEWPEAFCEL